MKFEKDASYTKLILGYYGEILYFTLEYIIVKKNLN